MDVVHRSRLEWLGMDDRAVETTADQLVLQYGLGLYGYEANMICELPSEYEECRDYFCKCEISKRQGWNYGESHEPPFYYNSFYPKFVNGIRERMSARG